MELILRSALLYGLCTVLVLTGTSQSTEDMEVWLSLAGDYKLNDRWELTAEQQIRFDENVTEVKNYFTELELQYELNKAFDVHLRGRFIRRNDNRGNIQGYENHFRYQGGLSYRHRFHQFIFRYRALFQHRNELGVSEEEGDEARMHVRLRSAIEFRIKNWKYDPEIVGEFFKAVNKEDAGISDGFRAGIGTSRDYDAFGEFSFRYYVETTIDESDDELVHILSFKYTYTFR